MQLAEAELDQVLEPFFKKYPEEDQKAMTAKEYEAVDAEWARLIIDTYRRALYWTKNLEKRSVTVKLEKNEAGYYTISDDEFKKLDALVIDYSDPQRTPASTPTQTPDPEETAPADPSATPGENDPVPPTTASPAPDPEESKEPEESAPPQESPTE